MNQRRSVLLVLGLLGVAGVTAALSGSASPAAPGTSQAGRGPASAQLTRNDTPEPVPTPWKLVEALRPPIRRVDPDERVVDVGFVANQFPVTTDDLGATIDVQITQEIIDKAAELGTPQAMYEFVRNECAFQAYFGSRKGSVETLRQRAGNDYDLASLLIALLRSANFPSRYAVGLVDLPVAQALDWLGVEDASVAGSILFTHGLEGTLIVDPQSNPVAVRARRVWVEAFVPIGYGSPAWVPLDPALKLRAVQDAGLDAPAAMGLDALALVDEYFDPGTPSVTLPRPETVLEFTEQEVQAWLDINAPGATVAQVKRSSMIQPELIGTLPASLPYTVRTRDAHYAEIPANRRYRLRFHLYDGATTLIDHTVDLPTVASRRITIDYVGATPADQAILDANGGIYQTPPSLVDLSPVLRIDGVDQVTAGPGVGMGLSHNADVHFLAPTNDFGLPANVVPTIFNTMVSGAAQAHAFAIDGVSETLLVPPPASDDEGLASLLWQIGLDYVGGVRNADQRLGELMHGYVTTGVTNAIVSNVVKVTFSGGVPQTFDWGGLVVDADRAVIGYWPVDGLQPSSAEPKDFLAIAGADGSLAESRVYEDGFGQDSVSTIKLLQLAVDAGVTVYKHWNTLPLPANTQPASVQNALSSAILAGNEVTFPADPMTIGDVATGQWTGTAWIDMDPLTGAAGYIISGGLNGGATVETWPPEFVDLSEGDKTVQSVRVLMKGGVSPVGDSPAPEAVFTRDDEQHLTFEYQIEVTYTDASVKTLPSASSYYQKTTQNTTKTFVPGNYRFHVWLASQVWWLGPLASAERNVSVVGVLIREDDGSPFGGDPPPFLSINPAGLPDCKVELKALVIPELAPDGSALAQSYAWSGGSLVTFVTPTAQVTEITATMPSSALEDQDVDVSVGLPGGKSVDGYARFDFTQGGMDERHKLTVVRLDLEVFNGGADLDNGQDSGPQGDPVPDADEESVGAYLLVNWDDDDADGSMNADGSWSALPVPDLNEASVANEDNLAKLIPTFEPLVDEGVVALELKGGAGLVKLWSLSSKGTEIALSGGSKQWDLSDAAQKAELQGLIQNGLWIEGVAASASERDVELELTYEVDGQAACPDKVKATVVRINLANAVYRDNQIWTQGSRGHSALVWRFNGPLTRDRLDDDASFQIIEIAGPTDNRLLTTITQAGNTVYGCFTNPGISDVQRLRILAAARSLVGANFSYPNFGANTIEPDDWDGRLTTITGMRCDGLIEVCYEINGVNVWGMRRTPDNNTIHYDITDQTDQWDYNAITGGWSQQANQLPDNLEEHNDFDIFGWADVLMPATQCGHVAPQGAATLFAQQDLCMPVGTTGGN